MASNKKLIYEIPFFIHVYDDGTVDRLAATPYTAPSLQDPISGISSKDVIISPDVSARLYLPRLTPASLRKLPILVYIHGGGFIMGSAFTILEHNYLNTMVSYINAVIISVEYRLAPEHLLPVAYDDCWTALQWVASHSIDGGENQEPWLVEYGDFDRLYMGGDSAGGNIVHNLALKAGKERLNNDVKILGGFYCCPYFWGSEWTPEESLAYKCWMLANPHAEGGIDNHMINPFVDGQFAAEFGYKKVLVVATEKDEVREIDIKYVEAVKASKWDGEVQFLQIDGEGHCFYLFDITSDKAKIVMEQLASFII